MTTVSFTRDMVMDVEACRALHDTMTDKINAMHDELNAMHKFLNSNLRSNWVGGAAFEYFGTYDRIFPAIKGQLALLEGMNKKYLEEIVAWEMMASQLEP